MNLDVDSPEKVPDVLDEAAQRFHDDAGELEAAWQDANAGRPWTLVAKELEASAERIRRKLD